MKGVGSNGNEAMLESMKLWLESRGAAGGVLLQGGDEEAGRQEEDEAKRRLEIGWAWGIAKLVRFSVNGCTPESPTSAGLASKLHG